MNKYIDAEKLKAEINEHINLMCLEKTAYAKARVDEAKDILNEITSLQQEQPEPSCKSCGFYENNCPFIRDKFIPYPNRVCKDYTYSVMKEQEHEQPQEPAQQQ